VSGLGTRHGNGSKDPGSSASSRLVVLPKGRTFEGRMFGSLKEPKTSIGGPGLGTRLD
jgi:hypothetical protein